MSQSKLAPVALIVGLTPLACGPGGIANSGGEDGIADTGTTGEPAPEPEPEPPPGFPCDFGEPCSETETETETETGSDDWTEPGDGDGDPEPDPIDVDCSLSWIILDSAETHGHLGETPIGAGPGGDLITINPMLIGDNPGIVDSWVRRRAANGDLVWTTLVSWGELRDDPLAAITDELGDLVLAGRTDVNTQLEDALIAKLDGDTGEKLWTFLRGEQGGYQAVTTYGTTFVAVGTIGTGSDARIEVVALDGDTGELVWSTEPFGVGGLAARAHGIEVVDGEIYVLVDLGQLELVRLVPPDGGQETVAVLGEDSAWGPAMVRSGPDHVATVHRDFEGGVTASRIEVANGGITQLLLPTPDGTPVGRVGIADLGGGQGLAVVGTVEVDDVGTQYIVHLDENLGLGCTNSFTEVDVGTTRPPELRGVAAGSGGGVYTGSFIDIDRLSVFARWD